MKAVKYSLAVIAVFLWIGFVCAISFMEAWLKFKAPGITLSLGLGIGRIVFSALNKVEWVMAMTIIVNYILVVPKDTLKSFSLFSISLLILILQTFYFLPALDVRAQMHIEGFVVPPSNLHIMYIGLEVVKVISLIVFGIKLFK